MTWDICIPVHLFTRGADRGRGRPLNCASQIVVQGLCNKPLVLKASMMSAEQPQSPRCAILVYCFGKFTFVLND